MSTRQRRGSRSRVDGGTSMLGPLRNARPALTTPARPAIYRWALLFLVGIQVPSIARSVPGDLDPTFAGFGDGGRLIIPQSPNGMALEPDGRIVLVGSTDVGIWVMRLLANGTPDNSFSDDGFATFVHPAFGTAGFCVAIQPDHKIVVAGGAGTHPPDFMVMR